MALFLSIRARSLIATLAATCGLVVIGAMGVHALQTEVEHATRFIDREFSASTSIAKVHAGIANTRRYEKDMFLNMADDDALERYRVRWRAELTAATAELDPLSERVDAESAPLIGTLREGLASYAKGVEDIVTRIRTGVINDPWSANAAMEPHKTSVRAADKAFEEIIRRTGASAESARLARQEAARKTTLTLVGLVLGALALIVPILFFNGRATVRAIDRVRRVAERIAGGDLSVKVEARGQDETAAMMRALATMQHSLQALVQRVQAGVENVSSASGEIASGNADLSRRTEEQARALQQTSSAMQQIADSVRAHAAQASEALRFVQTVAETAETSGRQVRHAMGTMQAISESSQRIGEISQMVDSIAFQTNLLALNAAVEAARAGEHGRGFAVVAGEVRTLSQRCAGAAREIGELIGESGRRINTGRQEVEQAGVSMDRVVSEVQRVGEWVTGLAAATQQQAVRVSEVGEAVVRLDALTQHNTQLVSASAQASASLDEQARLLSSALGQFSAAGEKGSVAAT